MSPLHRKLLRDLWAARGQAFAIALLVALASASFLGSTWTYRSLLSTQRAYYERYRFAELFAGLTRAPESLAERLRAVPGVAEVAVRAESLASVELPGFDEPVSAQLLSVPAGRQPSLNQLHLRSGRLPAADDEVAIGEAFAEWHRLRPGATLTLLLNGRRQQVRMVGIALSPEFVLVMRPGDVLPDDAHFGLFWMTEEALAAALDLEGAFNSVSATLGPEASLPEAIAAFDRLLAPYGGRGAIGRADQASHRFISEEIRQLRTMAIALPSIFLTVAAFLLSVILSRMVAIQRQQIGTLKALGRSNAEIGLHLAGFAVVVVAAGSLAGIGLGYWMGSAFTRLYVMFYRFPVLLLELSPGPVVSATALCLGAAGLGVGGSLRRAVRLAPAEAMRPEPPASFRPTLLERLGLGRLLSVPGLMVLRALSRRPGRAAMTVFGIAAGVAVVVTGSFSGDALDFLTRYQFEQVEREDMTVTFSDALSDDALLELKGLPGVLGGEPFRAVAVELRSGTRRYRTALLGLEPRSRLRRIVDASGRSLALPAEGMLASRYLGELLGVEPGAQLQVAVLEGRRQTRQVRLAGFVDDLVGISAYLPLSELNGLLEEGRLVSGAYLEIDPARERQLYRLLRERPEVAGVTLRSAAVASLKKTMDQYLGVYGAILKLIAAIIAAGVVYNAARISLAERERELATLRVIGFTRLETFRVVAEELAIQVLLAIPAGFLLGYGFAAALARGLGSDLFRLPLALEPESYASAAMVVSVAAVAVAAVVWRWMGKLELVAVLKTRE